MWRLSNGEREAAVEVSGPFQANEIPSVHQAIVAGIGIGPISLFASARMRGLVRVLPKYVSADVPVSLVSPSKRLEPACVPLLREFLAAKLTSLRWRG